MAGRRRGAKEGEEFARETGGWRRGCSRRKSAPRRRTLAVSGTAGWLLGSQGQNCSLGLTTLGSWVSVGQCGRNPD